MISVAFWTVILAQAIWFVVVTAYCGNSKKLLQFLISGIALGVPYGLIMDSLVGYRSGIFNYGGLEASIGFLLINALLSYGLAISTMFNFTSWLSSGLELNRRFSYLFLLIGSALLFVHSRYGGTHALADMFSLGVIILSFSDAVLLIYSGRSLLYNLVRLQGAIFRLGCVSVATGAAYEIANAIAGLWFWENDFPNEYINLLMIVVLGYHVLLFPMLVLAIIFKSTLISKTS